MTSKQKAIMRHVLTGYSAGKWWDIDLLIETLSLSSSKQAMQCSIRFLERRGLLTRAYEVRRDRKRMVLIPTSAAFSLRSSGVL